MSGIQFGVTMLPLRKQKRENSGQVKHVDDILFKNVPILMFMVQ